MRKFLVIFGFLLPLLSLAQGVELGKAMGYAREGQYDRAISLFENILSKDPSNSAAIDGLARALFENGKYVEAADWFRKMAQSNPGFDRLILAKSYLYARNFQSARGEFKKLIASEPSNPKWVSWIRLCDSLSRKVTQREGKPAISILTVNNHDNAGGAAVYQADKLLFSSRVGNTVSLVYSPMKREGKYIDFYAVHTLAKPIPGKADCYAAIESVTGKVWFTRVTSNGDSIPAVMGGSGSGIFSGIPKEGSWENESAFTFNSTVYNVRHPAPAGDGTFLIFASDMPGGLGGYDLWISHFKNGWQQPENLGPEINTEANEVTPVLAEDEQTLFFASDGHKGLGKLDIFSVSRAGEEWKNRIHLSFPLNSQDNDHSYYSVGSGIEGFFSSDRPGGFGGEDIFLFEYPAEKKACVPQEPGKICVTLFEEVVSVTAATDNLYQWNTGDGFAVTGNPAKYCFQKPGYYPITLTLTETIQDEYNTWLGTVYTDLQRTVPVGPRNSAWIQVKETNLIATDIDFDGGLSTLEDCEIISWRWEFGDGTLGFGRKVKHIYDRPGEYEIRLSVIGIKDDLSGTKESCVNKRMMVSGR